MFLCAQRASLGAMAEVVRATCLVTSLPLCRKPLLISKTNHRRDIDSGEVRCFDYCTVVEAVRLHFEECQQRVNGAQRVPVPLAMCH